MMVFGVLFRSQQGGVIDFGPAAFYQFLTLHGTGMIGAAALATAGIMWYFLSHYVQLSRTILKTNLVLFLIGVVMIIVGIFAFDYSGTWTFLYPLPAISAGAWGTAGARSEEHTSELQSRGHLVCRLLLEIIMESALKSHALA